MKLKDSVSVVFIMLLLGFCEGSTNIRKTFCLSHKNWMRLLGFNYSNMIFEDSLMVVHCRTNLHRFARLEDWH